MNNQTQTLLHECLVSTGHVESCAAFRRKDVLLRANSNGFMVSSSTSYFFLFLICHISWHFYINRRISGLAAIMNSGPMPWRI